MDGIKRPKLSQRSLAPDIYRRRLSDQALQPRVPTRPGQQSTTSQPRGRRVIRISLSFRMPQGLRQAIRGLRQYLPANRKYPVIARIGWSVLAAVMALTAGIEVVKLIKPEPKYGLSDSVEMLIGEGSPRLAQSLKLNKETRTYEFNQGYQPNSEVAGESMSPKFTASFNKLPEEGATVVDPVTETKLTFKPDFGVLQPLQDQNRLVYPLKGKDGMKVYTLKATGLKEDIVLESSAEDRLSFKYELGLAEGTEVRVEEDGSLGVYGVSAMLLGDVPTGTAKDKELLKKARHNGEKNTLLFRLPAPFIMELGGKPSKAKAWFSLKGNDLTLHAANLKQAHYPLTIDPSVYVETAAKLMRGNNETNLDFDVDNELIQKGKLTGARFDEWNNTMDLNENRWSAGTAVAGGHIYSVGGTRSNMTVVTYSAPGSTTFAVPSGVTSITVKTWGAGGGGGGGGTVSAGGAGGGGGFAQSTLTVTAGEVLNVHVGGAGGAGDFSTGTSGALSGDGGGGGGHSEVDRAGTPLIIAPAGGGGGGGDNSLAVPGGQGGPGGGTTGVAGSASNLAGGGGAGTSAAGGAGGSGGANAGSGGGSEAGGAGADGRSGSGVDGSKNNGGTASGGAGGNGDANSSGFGAGGGGGSGRFGGGGGGGSASGDAGGGGGGGGSSYTTGSSPSTATGTNTNPGNASDTDRAGAGEGGAGGATSNSGTAGTDGRIVISYVVGAGAANEARPEVYWSRFNTTNKTIESANPGAGTCTDWCTDDAYNLPAARSGLSLVAYNGFLYAMGGVDSAGARSDHVYIAKLGANGEPSLWHPTSTDKNDWVYWYRDAGTNLSSERSYTAAAAYNNRLYILGGQTNAGTGGTTTVEYADIKPTGTFSNWTTTGMSSLPSIRHNHTIHIYNDRIYLIGGNSAGTLQATVHYSKLNNDGTMNNWISTNSFNTARMTWGGSYTTVWGGYLYISGGCSAINGSGYCTTIASDIQLASINADGSLAAWDEISNLTNQRMGYSLVSWRNAIYRVGGCVTQDTVTGDCSGVLASASYGLINQDGDASTVNNSVASGTSPCSGGSPTDCNIPPAGDTAGGAVGGRMSSGTVINNGHIYIIGGCATSTGASSCSTGAAMSGNVSYAALSSTGNIVSPSSCPSATTYGSWCVESRSANQLNGTSGMGAMATAVFNNVVYVIGGTTGTTWSTNVYYVSLNANGSLSGPWTQQTFANLDLDVDSGTAGYQPVGYSYAFARANPGSASTYPGNLYVVGGCQGGTGVGCTDYYTTVYKCNIATTGALETADANDCTTSGQLQLDSETGTGGSQGLGLMAGTLYANYIYLVGGSSPNFSQRGEVMYAKIDSNNDIVDADTSTSGIWETSPNVMDPIRRRGYSFGYNGYLYSLAGYSGTSSLNDLLFAKIDVGNGSIGAFTTSQVTVTSRWDLRAIVSNGYVYAIGGCSAETSAPGGCTQTEGSIQTFQLYNNHSGSPAKYSDSWYDLNWAYRKTLTVDSTKVPADQTEFPMLVSITDPDIAANAQTDADDILFTSSDGTTKLSHEIEKYTTGTGELVAWVKVPSLSASSNTTIYMYYGNGAASNQQDVANVWDSNYRAVYHLKENPATTCSGTSEVCDSTTNANHADSNGSMTSGDQVAGKIGGSLDLDGTNDFMSAPNSTSLNITGNAISIVGWVNSPDTSPNGATAIKSNDAVSAYYGLTFESSTIWGYSDTGGAGWNWNTGQTISAGWHQVAYTYDGTTQRLYIDGSQVATHALTGSIANSSTEPLWIGRNAFTGFMQALLDEVRISANARSANWIQTEYNNTNSPNTFYSIGSQESPSTPDSLFTTDRIGAGSAVLNGYLYIAGGCTSASDCTTAISNVQYAALNPDGSVGTWANTTSALPDVRAFGQLEAAGGTLYYIGGQSSTATDERAEVYYGTPSSGDVSAWNTATNGLPAARTQHSATVWNNRIYVTGGLNASAAAQTTVYTSPDLSAGGNIASAWTTAGMTAFSVARSGHTAIAYAGNLYVMGGLTGSTYLSDVQYAKINSDGTVGAWSYTTSLPQPIRQADGFAANGFMYLFGGRSADTVCTNNTYVAPISANTTIAAGNNPTGLGEWYQTNVKYTGNRYGLTAVYDGGRGYILGGACGSTLTYTGAARVTSSTLQSQPQIAKYSRLIDTDTDVFPTKWLVNGLDNDTGARWYMRYGSSTSASATWGQETNFGHVTLGQPENYIPLDGAGANTNFARYFYLSLTIDSSQAFGYPEDVSRGPTIADLSLFFTSDPSKRMRHGKTFTGGEQQPLDTPF